MKVLLHATHDEFGGVQLMWRDLAEALIARGHEAKIYYLYKRGVGSMESYEHVLYPSFGKMAVDLLRNLANTLRMEGADTILTAQPLANLILPLLARGGTKEVKVFVTYHGPDGISKPLLGPLSGMIASTNRVEKVISISDAVRDLLPSKLLEKTVVIRNALSARVEQEIDRQYFLRNEAQRDVSFDVVAVGRLSREKNFQRLIAAVALIKGVTLGIIGDGPERDNLAACILSFGVGDRVELLGQRSRVDVLSILGSASIFAQPSISEGRSLALLEAQRMGLPIIISSIPPQIEAATSLDGTLCCIAVDPVDGSALSDAIRRLTLSPGLRAHLGKLSRSTSLQHCFSDMFMEYLSVLGLP